MKFITSVLATQNTFYIIKTNNQKCNKCLICTWNPNWLIVCLSVFWFHLCRRLTFDILYLSVLQSHNHHQLHIFLLISTRLNLVRHTDIKIFRHLLEKFYDFRWLFVVVITGNSFGWGVDFWQETRKTANWVFC